MCCTIAAIMPADSRVRDFVERGRANGASDDSLVGILVARGWPEKEVYEALAEHYERLTGVEIPRRGGPGVAAKDAFLYLLAFATLATWTIGVGSVAFTLVDRWLSDTLFSQSYYPGYDTYSVSAGIAATLVAFPIYLLVSFVILRENSSHPEKLISPVRRWLTYMALVIAAGVFIGDLITSVTYLLRGEITSRFLAKALVVFLISGGVFFYYFWGLKKPEEPAAGAGFTRDRLMAVLSLIAVAVTVAFGFSYTGAPRKQRALRADQKRLQDLYQLSSQINGRWKLNGSHLPQHLDDISGVPLADPVTRISYEYHLKDGSHYELCAVFSLPSPDTTQSTLKFWTHSAGRYCFAFDASQQVESPGYYNFSD